MSAGSSPSGAALPWAANSASTAPDGDAAQQARDQQQQRQGAAEEAEPQPGQALEAFGLAIGSRIEVRPGAARS